MKVPKNLIVDAVLTASGIDVKINGKSFPIIYPKKIWSAYPKNLKEVLLDNVAYSSTLFLPQMFKLREVEYKTTRPLSETFLFKNGIYDMPISALADGKIPLEYIKRFFNTRQIFKSEQIKYTNLAESLKKTKSIIVPFTFGKETLLTYALACELGLTPVLVYVIEPSHTYEYLHKKKLIQRFEKEFKTKINMIKYGPGIFRYGKLWNLNTDLGWGLHTTDYCILMAPFFHYFKADILALGNEPSCNDFFYDQDLLIYKAAYDQHLDWTAQQSLLASLLLGKKVKVTSLVEPVYEVAETKVLQGRYPAIGKYQMSCETKTPAGKKNRWCQDCSKCSYMFAMFSAFGFDTKSAGFTENLLDQKHDYLYKHLFTSDSKNPEYGSKEELSVAFYLMSLRKQTDFSVKKFEKTLLQSFLKNKKKLLEKFLTPQSSKTIPEELKKRIFNIYNTELHDFAA